MKAQENQCISITKTRYYSHDNGLQPCYQTHPESLTMLRCYEVSEGGHGIPPRPPGESPVKQWLQGGSEKTVTSLDIYNILF